jgi:hypothetical protein
VEIGFTPTECKQRQKIQAPPRFSLSSPNEERAGVRSQKSFPQNKFLLRIGWGEGGRRPDEVNREIRKPRERGLTPINFPRTLAALETPKRRLLFN